MGVQRILAGSPAELSWTPVDGDGTSFDPGVVTVTVTGADGVAVATDAATTGSGTAARTYALSSVQTADTDVLSVAWSVDDVVIARTSADIVGAVYLTQAEAAAIEPTLIEASPAVFARARAEVETMFEQVCRQAFVPRFSVFQVPANGALRVPHLREVRWVSTQASDRSWSTPSTTVPSVTYRYPTSASRYGVEHGLDSPPADLLRSAALAIRRQVTKASAGVDPRAMSYTTPDGQNVMLATPGLSIWITGVPEIDETLKRYTRPLLGVA